MDIQKEIQGWKEKADDISMKIRAQELMYDGNITDSSNQYIDKLNSELNFCLNKITSLRLKEGQWLYHRINDLVSSIETSRRDNTPVSSTDWQRAMELKAFVSLANEGKL